MKKFENYKSNLKVLIMAKHEDLENEFIIESIIYIFNLQFELGWKVLKEFLRYEGRSIANTGSTREIIKAAYSVYDFIDEDVWLRMLKDQNNTTHIYDSDITKELVQTILDVYIPEFIKLEEKLNEHYEDIRLF